MKQYKFIVSGGGTGGHIFPALSIARGLQGTYPGCEILFVGAKGKMEMEKVPANGFPIKGIWIDGFQRSVSFRNVLFPLKLLVSLIQACLILLRFRPDAAIGTGGFASGSLLIVACWLKIPTLIQEQNSYPGITNKVLGRYVNTVCVAFENLNRFFPQEKLRLTGNPVRSELYPLMTPRNEAQTFFGLNPKKQTLVILGGSLGARAINALIASQLEIIRNKGFQILWQCGKLYYEQYRHLEDEGIVIRAFVKEMEKLYAAADIIVSRAGAGTLAELCCAAKPVILIPSPNVAENHQYHNAKNLVNQEAALLIAEKDVTTAFEPAFDTLVKNRQIKDKMQNALTGMARPKATESIIKEIQALL